MKQIKIVALGGGAGLPIVLYGLRKYDVDLTAVVCVTDTGRSSGILREDLKILSPGDIRNCLIALSDADEEIKQLVSYRFEDGFLAGMSFGNLLIAALAKIHGSFEKGLEALSSILKVKGRVFPATLELAEVCAELIDGQIIESEKNIIAGKHRIKKIFLKPENVKAHPEAVKKILDADLVVIGPGSLYTSVIVNLIVKEIKDAILKSKAKKVYVCNIMTQPSQTLGYKVSDHIRAVEEHLGQAVDYVIVNTKRPSEEILKSYEEEGATLVEYDKENIQQHKTKIVEADVVAEKPKEKIWKKMDLLKHDPRKLAPILLEIAKEGLQ
jgi:uncharacterized cofD-like protein